MCCVLSSVYVICFFTFNLFQPKNNTQLIISIINNALFIIIFAMHHSFFAREKVKKVITKVIPKEMERSTYILVSSILLLLIPLNFKDSGIIVWDFQSTVLGDVLLLISVIGWFISFISSCLINPLDIFGIRQSFMLKKKKRKYLKPH